MKKEIYKDIPANFHRQFCQTLMELEDTPHAGSSLGSAQHTPQKGSRTSHRRRRRKYGIFLAAAILVCACASVAAAGLMGWHKRMSERFGTDRALEKKLSAEQAAIPQSAAIDENQLKFQALQAVRTDSYDYFLLRMTLPEGIDWNDDIIFEDVRVINQEIGCVANFVSDSLEENTVLVEIQLLYSGKAPSDVSEVRVQMKNLIQTRKTELFGYLVKGEWEIPLTLPPRRQTPSGFIHSRPSLSGSMNSASPRPISAPSFFGCTRKKNLQCMRHGAIPFFFRMLDSAEGRQTNTNKKGTSSILKRL